MAFPTAVNNQITDAVTQANVKVLGDAPSVALGNFYIATSQALSNAAHNASTAQQQSTVTAQAATTQGVSTLYAIDTAATGKTSFKVTNATIEGHIYTKIASPYGKQELQKAVDQANDSSSGANQTVLNECYDSLCTAIHTALENNVSKQAIAYTLHEVMAEKNICMLYPFNVDEPVSIEQIEAYYHAIIAAGYEH